VGFSGDPVPRGAVSFGPEQQRRTGDFRAWQAGYDDDWRKRPTGKQWGRDHELWDLDVRDLDLGLVGDKIERALREAFTKYQVFLIRHYNASIADEGFRCLLIDSRPRRMVIVLPSSLATPLLSQVLDTLFNRFLPPTISLLSAPIATSVAAGVRSALIIDLGWAETLVTGVYEYRGIRCDRSIRAGRLLVAQMSKLLGRSVAHSQGKTYDDSPENPAEEVVSFEECDDITSRLAWCKPARGSSRPSEQDDSLPTVQEQDDSLPTVQEQDDSELQGPASTAATEPVSVPLMSAHPPTTVKLSHLQLAEPCENAFFGLQYSHASFDDDELPLHLLVYRSLLQLPVDVRAICMSRIIFTGGCSKVLGLRKRIFDEVSQLIQERGWDPVVGKSVEQLRLNPKLKRGGSRQARRDGPTGSDSQVDSGGGEQDGVWHDAANAGPEVDLIEEQLRKGSGAKPTAHGELRAVDSLGPWSGASLLTQLKVPAIATIDRELWLQQGASGAARPSDVDFKTQQRQSMGPGGLMRNAAAGANWTLGVWGAV